MNCLEQVYDTHKDKVYGPLVKQFRNYTRLRLDLDVAVCLNIRLGETDLRKLYDQFYSTLSRLSRREKS
ncbi:MAG: hypothetical protein ABWK01_01665 [Infirmifilum sp.]